MPDHHPTPAPGAAVQAAHGPTARGFALLTAGVPLSLLLDLALPVDSAAVYRDEPADTSWVPSAVA